MEDLLATGKGQPIEDMLQGNNGKTGTGFRIEVLSKIWKIAELPNFMQFAES